MLAVYPCNRASASYSPRTRVALRPATKQAASSSTGISSRKTVWATVVAYKFDIAPYYVRIRSRILFPRRVRALAIRTRKITDHLGEISICSSALDHFR